MARPSPELSAPSAYPARVQGRWSAPTDTGGRSVLHALSGIGRLGLSFLTTRVRPGVVPAPRPARPWHCSVPAAPLRAPCTAGLDALSEHKDPSLGLVVVIGAVDSVENCRCRRWAGVAGLWTVGGRRPVRQESVVDGRSSSTSMSPEWECLPTGHLVLPTAGAQRIHICVFHGRRVMHTVVHTCGRVMTAGSAPSPHACGPRCGQRTAATAARPGLRWPAA